MINWIKNTGVKPIAFKNHYVQAWLHKTKNPSRVALTVDDCGWFLDPNCSMSIQYYRLLFKTREEAREAKRLSSMDLSIVKLEEKIRSYHFIYPSVKLGWALELSL